MPNHVTHRMTIEGPEADRAAFVDAHIRNGVLDFETVIPCPDESRASWYSWNIENWGTKWNAYRAHVKAQLGEFIFNTAWSAPTPVFNAVAKRWPSLKIHVSSFDEGWNFACDGVLGDTYRQVPVSDALYERVYGYPPSEGESES